MPAIAVPRRAAVPARPDTPRIIARPQARAARAVPPARSSIARAGRLDYRDLPFQVAATTADGSYFEGYAAVYNNVDEYGTIMARGCFDQDIGYFRDFGFLGFR